VFLKTPWLFPLLTLIFGAFLAWILLVPRATSTTTSTNPEPVNTRSKPSPTSSQSSGAPEFILIRGSFVIVGKQPDGDSMRFIADDTSLLNRLKNHGRIRVSKDNSVQLRFEAIDAPELHYLGQAQPLGSESRDALLKLMRFKAPQFKSDGATVTAASPESVRGAILSTAAEGNGRPISYVLFAKDVKGYSDGALVKVSDAILQKTLNAKQLENGMAYLTVYSSTPQAHQVFLRGLAQKARTAKLGVWARDASANFKLVGKESVNERGALIFPKLFRRCISYLNAKAKNPSLGSITDWMISTQTTGVSEDDLVNTKGQTVRLSNLLTVAGAQVKFVSDTTEIVFVEK
jgi:endonuclease YncB( thermonuclease family)